MKSTQLYHYCSNNSFVSIVQSSAIRLSSLSLSNDSLEGKLAQQAFIKIANENKVAVDKIEDIKRAFLFLESYFDGLGFCLSEEPDLLSQWRGYADDGEGISIGFATAQLEELTDKNDSSGIKLNKVEYSDKQHTKKLLPIFTEINSLIQSGEIEVPSRGGLLIPKNPVDFEKEKERFRQGLIRLVAKIATLLPDLFVMKSQAFSEEKEWRLLSLIDKSAINNIDFYAKKSLITPFKELNLGKGAIEQVVIGPKNKTPLYVIQSLLRKNGFTNAEVTTSSATYR